MATLHRYKRGHTPQIQKGAKTSNSGVERNAIRYKHSKIMCKQYVGQTNKRETDRQTDAERERERVGEGERERERTGEGRERGEGGEVYFRKRGGR